MPVPVPRISKPLAHPVNKSANRALGQTQLIQNIPSTLPVPPPGPPPSSGTREEWSGALPSWRRNKQRPIWDEDSLPTEQRPGQDFHQGLAAADNASVIKGAHAEAWIPPMYSLRQDSQVAGAYDPHHSGVQGNGYGEIGSGHTAMDQAQFETNEVWDTNSFSFHDGNNANGEVRYHPYGNNSSPAENSTCNSQLGAFTPIFEDQSPGSTSGPDSGFSPLTPFGDFVDRAVAAAQNYSSSGIQFEDRGVASEQYQKQVISDVYAAPVFPSIADLPKLQDPIPDTVTPSATVSYKKLTEPLSEWVAKYVWKVCTTGFSLPPAFSQPSMNAGPYAVGPPSYLAPSIHTLLLSTLLQPSAVFLAIWYIVRLPVYFDGAPIGAEFVKERNFRTALLGDAHVGFEREASENSAPFRVVVLGCMLANKWLDDHTFSNKTWHSISNIPVQTLNALESLALDIFSYDLSISSHQWSQWLSRILSYHQSLTSPNRPQPISRPSSNPHSIVRRAIEEIIQAPAACKSVSDIPQPVFLGLEERLREKLEKEEAMAMDILEIDLDEDGPLKEEYLPKRRASKLGSRNAQSRDMSSGEKWNASEVAPVKTLPPPAKWSPAGDEPILRDRNRSSGHYVAVQAPPVAVATYPASCQPQDMQYDQNWNPPGAYMPVKPHAGYLYDLSSVFRVSQPAYNPFGHIASIALPHSRSQSLSYDQDNMVSRNHMRSYSQSRFDYRCSDLRMSVGEYNPIPETQSRWMEAASHYPYSGPAFVPLPASGMQSAW